TNGQAQLWKFHTAPGGGTDLRESKRSGAADADYALAAFNPGGTIDLYVEATAASALRGITIEFQYRLPGGAWRTFDRALATAVWVTKDNVFNNRVNVIRATMVDPVLKPDFETVAIAADNSTVGYGRFERVIVA